MRRTVLILNGIVIVFFSCFLAYTFFAQKHVESLARDFVTEKTVDYSKPVVDGVGEALDSSKFRVLLPEKQKALILDEISKYRKDPRAYISDLTGKQELETVADTSNPLLAKVVGFKKVIRQFYQDALDALIFDLRIVAICNLIAGIIAFVLGYQSPREIRKSLVGISMIIFLGVLYCSFMYVDDLNFFRILFRMHPGWLYGLLLALTIFEIYLRHGKEITLEAHREDAAEAKTRN